MVRGGCIVRTFMQRRIILARLLLRKQRSLRPLVPF